MQVWALTLIIGIPAGIAGGWFTATMPSDIGVAAAHRGATTPQVDNPGLLTGHARQAFVSLGMPTMPAVQEATAVNAAMVAPVKPIGQQLSEDLTAVMSPKGKGQYLIVVDREHGGARRQVKVGQEFRDGWIVSAIHSQAIILRHEGQEVSVSLFGNPGDGAAPADVGPAPATSPGQALLKGLPLPR